MKMFYIFAKQKHSIRHSSNYGNGKDRHKDNRQPKIKRKIIIKRQKSLFLEYYLGYSKEIDKATGKEKIKILRRKEFLNLYLSFKPRGPEERLNNRETLELAKSIRAEKEQEFKLETKGYRLKKDRSINFLDYFDVYLNEYTKKDVRMIKLAFVRFKDFLKAYYPHYNKSIKPEQITKDMIIKFVEYLQTKSTGEGAKSLFQRFKKVVKHAIEHDIMFKNPCAGVVCNVDDQTLKKDILSPEEQARLFNTHYDNENPEIRRAFAFCLFTGIRFCDVIKLKYKNVDFSNRILSFNQSKTTGHSAASGVVIPLNDNLISILESSTGENEPKRFNISSAKPHNVFKSIKPVDKEGRNKQTYYMALRPAQLRSQYS
jgi:integrase